MSAPRQRVSSSTSRRADGGTSVAVAAGSFAGLLQASGSTAVPGAHRVQLPSSNVAIFSGILSSVMTKSSGLRPLM